MASNTKYYYSLPTQPPQQSRSGSRRPPLTPSAVSSPCITTHAPIASRRDSGSGSPTKASALLARIASNPVSPRGETPTASPMPSPTTKNAELASSPLYTPERPFIARSESARYVRQYRQQGTHPQAPFWDVAELTLLQTATSAFLISRSSRIRTTISISTESIRL